MMTLNNISQPLSRDNLSVSPADFVPFILIPFIGWGVRRYKLKQDDFGPLKRRTFWIGISAYLVTELARSFYRPFIYAREINDFHIADTIGNSAGTITAIFMVVTMIKTGETKYWHLFMMVFAGLIGYELISGMGAHSVDLLDIFATVLFTGISAAVFFLYLEPRYN